MTFDAAQRADFLSAMLSTDRTAFDDTVEAMFLRDIPFVQTLRHLITPVLDDLGQMWRDDRASFVDVTLATCRVQTFVCEKLSTTAVRDRGGEHRGSIAFARPVGESHTLGLTVVAECFRIDGWDVLGGVNLEIGDSLWSMLSRQSVDVLGLTIGSAMQVPAIAAAIAQARKVSLNRNIVIAIGGYCIVDRPEIAEDIDADFIATDALDAVDTAASFLGRENRTQA